MKFWLKISLATLFVWGLSGQTVSTGDKLQARLRKIGDKLQCQCNPCGKTVGACDMNSCHYRDQVNGDIRPMIAAGLDDTAIIQKLREKFGEVILSAPPAEGFNLVGWAMPFLVLGLGLIVIRFALRRWRRPGPALAPSGPALDKYRDQIEKELADLD